MMVETEIRLFLSMELMLLKKLHHVLLPLDGRTLTSLTGAEKFKAGRAYLTCRKLLGGFSGDMVEPPSPLCERAEVIDLAVVRRRMKRLGEEREHTQAVMQLRNTQRDRFADQALQEIAPRRIRPDPNAWSDARAFGFYPQ